jgi:hypothetical protein
VTRRIVFVLAIAALLVAGGLLWLGRSASSLVRPRLAEVVAGATACKDRISDAFENAPAALPLAFGNVRCDLGTTGRYAQVRVDGQGAIHLTAQGFDNREVDGRTLLLVPFHDEATPKNAALAPHRSPVRKWVCRAPPDNGIPDRFLPATCRQPSAG